MVFGGVHLDSDGAPCSRLAVYRGISAFLRAAYTPKRCEAEGFEQLVDRLASNAETNSKPPRIRRPPAFGGSALGGLGCRLACRF